MSLNIDTLHIKKISGDDHFALKIISISFQWVLCKPAIKGDEYPE